MITASLSRSPVRLFGCVLLLSIAPSAAAKTSLPVWSPAGMRSAPVQNWKSLRDRSIEKQARDFSCGASSIATILKHHYGKNTSEAEVLKAIGTGDNRANFLSMQDAVGKLGFRALGLAVSFSQLQKLTIPVVVYLRYRRDDHFSVIRGIGPGTVLLADPSLGNRTFSRSQFLKMWETRTGAAGDEALKGRMLAILPVSGNAMPSSRFFVRNPRRQTEKATVATLRGGGMFHHPL